jgi:hypothetical protein
VALFQSVNHTLLAEKLLKEAGIAIKMIPVPRNLSSDCGVCIRFSPQDLRALQDALAGRVETGGIHPL